MKTKSCWSVICILTVILPVMGGCEPKEQLSPSSQLQATVTYETVMKMNKGMKFDRVADGIKKEEFTHTEYRMVYEQTAKGFDNQGNAVSDIKVKSLSYLAKNQQDVQFDFDSQRQADANKPLSQLVNQSYTIAVSPSGKVVGVSNAQQIMQLVNKTAPDSQIIAVMFSDDAIIKRHSIKGFPQSGDKKLSKGNKWIETETPQLGLITPKTFEKVYTVKNIKSSASGKLATIEMKALPSVDTVSEKTEASPQAAEIAESFKKFFDSKDDYTGELVMNLDSGKILKYSESLISNNTAAHLPANTKKKYTEPDVLEISLIWSHSIQALD